VLGVREDGLDGAAVLAQEPVDGRESRLGRLQPLGVGLDPVGVGPQLIPEVSRLEPECDGAGGEGIERRVDAGAARERCLRLAREPPGAAALLATGDRDESLPGGVPQRLGVAKPVPVGCKLLALGDVRARLIDLVELEAQQVDVALTRSLARLELVPFTAQRRHLRVDGPVSVAESQQLRPGEPVEDLGLGGGEGQLAVLVLAVEGEQP
jgi:hypothetical protein